MWGRGLRARANGPKCRRIVVGDFAFDPSNEGDVLGYHLQTPRTALIAVRPGLSPSQLYTVFLHELGHHFGLDHTTPGIMAPYPEQRTWKRLTLTLRKRLTSELAQLLVLRLASQLPP